MADAASDTVAQRVREVRQRRGMTAKDLAQRCAAIGAPHLTQQVVTNMETGRPGADGRRRRDITVGELLILAAALDVPPPYLIAPLSGDGVLEVTPSLALDAFGAAAWLTGEDMAVALGGNGQAQAVFRRARRPLDLLRQAWLAVDTLTGLRDEGSAGTDGYAVMLTGLRQRLEELDGLGVPTPPLPRWLSDDLAQVQEG